MWKIVELKKLLSAIPITRKQCKQVYERLNKDKKLALIFFKSIFGICLGTNNFQKLKLAICIRQEINNIQKLNSSSQKIHSATLSSENKREEKGGFLHAVNSIYQT